MVNRVRSIPMAFNAVHFGNVISAHRAELKMTLTEVAKLTTIHATTLSDYERGGESNMKMENFLSLCNLYDIDPREFFVLGE